MKTPALLLRVSLIGLFLGAPRGLLRASASVRAPEKQTTPLPAPAAPRSFLAPQDFLLLGGARTSRPATSSVPVDPALRKTEASVGAMGAALPAEERNRVRRHLDSFKPLQSRRPEAVVGDQQARERQRLRDAGL